MMWAAILIGIVLAGILQFFLPEKSLNVLDADRFPETRLADPGETVSIQIELQNRGRLPIPYAAVLCHLPFCREKQIFFSTWLGPRQKLTRHMPVTVTKRGRYVLEYMQLHCGDFLGLAEHRKSCGSFREIVVAPTSLRSPQLDRLLGGFLGDVSVNRFILEDPVLTLGYREYTGTEPMKRISWAQSARHNTLMVKKNDYTVDPSVSVLLNVQSDQVDEAVYEACFSAARSVCDALEKTGIRYSFSSNAHISGYRSTQAGVNGLGQRHFQGILETLGRSSTHHILPLQRLLEQDLKRPGQHGRILITPGGSEMESSLLRHLGEGENLLIIRGTEASLWQ